MIVTYSLTFSHTVEGIRKPLVVDGREVVKSVEADSKSAAIEHPDIVEFCEQQGNDTRPRRIW